MKKLLYVISLLLILFVKTVFCAPDLKFTPEGGGKFIYCNNPEGITADDLADGEKPVYLMNNKGLTPNRYIVYLTHFNLVTDSINEQTKVPGKNIYLNGIFTASEDSEIIISRTAFEVPENSLCYYTDNLNNIRKWDEGSFSSLHAHADLMNETIFTLHSDKVYTPSEQDTRTITLKKGESAYLGDYIENYTSVPYPKHVFLGADIEIISGSVDFNIFASYSEHLTTVPSHGFYVYDKTQKGIANSLPRVSAKLEYTIDDSVKNGDPLPVTIYNQYVPEGNTVTEWVTSLNPLADMYTKRIVAESDILSLYYRDPYKLNWYGSAVNEEDKNDVYIFDPFHSDTSHFPGNDSGYTRDTYIPNYPQSPENDEISYSCNMGNYGVATVYNITVHNNSSIDRYFDYTATCTSDLIVKVTDSDGNLLLPVISKGQTETQTTDTLSSILLPGGESTNFLIEMTLPVQNFGGPRQAFKISDELSVPVYKAENRYRIISPIGDKPSENDIDLSNPETVKTFSGKLDNYYFTKTDYGYAAYYHISAAKPFYYAAWWKICGYLYLLDDELNIIRKYDLGSPPTEISYAGGTLYVKTAKSGTFTITGTNDAEKAQYYLSEHLPRETSSGALIRNTDSNKIQISLDGTSYKNIHYQTFTPMYIEKDNGLFYTNSDGKIYYSYDGIYWFDEEKKNNSEEYKTAHKIMIGNIVLAPDRLPLIVNDRILVPMRYVFEELKQAALLNQEELPPSKTNGIHTDFTINWDQETTTATVFGEGNTVSFTVGKNVAYINGEAYRLDAPCINNNGRVMIPLRFLSEALGYNVEWLEESRLAIISGM